MVATGVFPDSTISCQLPLQTHSLFELLTLQTLFVTSRGRVVGSVSWVEVLGSRGWPKQSWGRGGWAPTFSFSKTGRYTLILGLEGSLSLGHQLPACHSLDSVSLMPWVGTSYKSTDFTVEGAVNDGGSSCLHPSNPPSPSIPFPPLQLKKAISTLVNPPAPK